MIYYNKATSTNNLLRSIQPDNCSSKKDFIAKQLLTKNNARITYNPLYADLFIVTQLVL